METSEKPVQKPKKKRTQSDKIGRLKYNQQLLKQTLAEVQEIRLMLRTIFAGLKGSFNFEQSLIERVVCSDGVDKAILQLLYEAGSPGSVYVAEQANNRVQKFAAIATPTPTINPSPSPTPTLSPSYGPTPSSTATVNPTPSLTPMPTSSHTLTPTPTPQPIKSPLTLSPISSGGEVLGGETGSTMVFFNSGVKGTAYFNFNGSVIPREAEIESIVFRVRTQALTAGSYVSVFCNDILWERNILTQ